MGRGLQAMFGADPVRPAGRSGTRRGCRRGKRDDVDSLSLRRELYMVAARQIDRRDVVFVMVVMQLRAGAVDSDDIDADVGRGCSVNVNAGVREGYGRRGLANARSGEVEERECEVW
jgi:hypothetical protein